MLMQPETLSSTWFLNYQIDGKTGTWLPYDSEVVEGVCFFMMRNVITSTTMLYYGQLFVKI